MTGTEASDHHGSHNGLLWLPDSASSVRRPLDAIIVPTVRRPSCLTVAADLAVLLGCTLVTLHSGKLTTAGKARRDLRDDVDLLAIDVPREGRLQLPRWRTSRLLEGTAFSRRSDLSSKRNVGLLLSRMLGWKRVLYLDDDITGLISDDVERASGMLDVHNAVGLKVGGFPDHSVVCHAYREAGGPQQAFIGGGAMVVHAERSTSFFPDIYNDDWFFLLDGKRGLQPVAAAGQVTQEPYDPFRTPDRARAEELGDVLAEGLYWLLDQGRSVADADRGHWEVFLAKREQFIRRVIDMVESGGLEASEKKRRTAALHGSLYSLSLISPTLCQIYLRALARDREQWQEHLDSVPGGMSRRQALNWLTVDSTPRPVAAQPARRPAVDHPAKDGIPPETPASISAATSPATARALKAVALSFAALVVAAIAARRRSRRYGRPRAGTRAESGGEDG